MSEVKSGWRNDAVDDRIPPLDEHNRTLLRNVHPEDWQNPDPTGVYDMVVLGAGTAGLVAATGAAGLGARVALVERKLMGGDCLNYGCVPSKALIHSAKVAHLRKLYGNPVDRKKFFREAMTSLRRKRADISSHDSARRLKGLGMDVFLGDARFTGRDSVEVGGKTLRFRKACIATGARASTPPIPGLETVPFLTNENLFNLTELPERLTIIGAGPIGAEMAQAFQRLGSQVTLIDTGPQILGREDSQAVAMLAKKLSEEGVNIEVNARITSVVGDDKRQALTLEKNGKEITVESNKLLVAAERAPNVEGVGLETAGVRFGRQGVEVNDNLRTSNSRIFACGDVASAHKFTHVADFQARIVIQNALFLGRKKASSLLIPWVTYTDPEVAHVGMYEKDAAEKGIDVQSFRLDFKDIDRSLLEEETEGFAEVLVKKGSDKIIGATLVHNRAGEMISEVTVAMSGGIGLGSIANVIHPYPTQMEILRKLGDLYNRGRLTKGAKRFLGFVLKLQRIL